MSLIWWILPAIAGVTGLMLLFAGFGRMAKLQPGSGFIRMLFGVGFLGLAGVVVFAGLNLQTFSRLALETELATIKFNAVDGTPGSYSVDMEYMTPPQKGTKYLEPKTNAPPVLSGDEFEISAQVIKFRPLANVLGYDAIYRFDKMQGQMRQRFSTQEVTTAEVNGIAFTENAVVDVYKLAEDSGKQFGIDAQYGSATYQPMADGFEYSIWMTQSGLIAKPTNATRAKMELGNYPGFNLGAESDKKTGGQ